MKVFSGVAGSWGSESVVPYKQMFAYQSVAMELASSS